MKTALLIDSTSDIDPIQADEAGFHVFLHTIKFAGESWLSHEDLTGEEFYRLLDSGHPLPASGSIQVSTYMHIVERLLQRYDHVLAIHPNRYVQEILGVACQAAQSFPGQVTVCESQFMSGGMVLLAHKAKRLLEEGLTPDQVLIKLEKMQTEARSAAFIDTVKYLKLSGQLPEFTDAVPEGVFPLIKIPQMQYMGGAINRSVGYRMLEKRFEHDLKRMGQSKLVLHHTPGGEEGTQLLREIAKHADVKINLDVTFGMILSSRIGPGAYGYALMPFGND